MSTNDVVFLILATAIRLQLSKIKKKMFMDETQMALKF